MSLDLRQFFVNAHTHTSFKKVIVCVSVKFSDIINSHADTIVNRENAEYLTNNIYNVNNIINKNGKIYNNAINIFTDESYIFTLGKELRVKSPIHMYFNYNVCVSKQLENRIRKINIVNKNGEEIMTGISQSGLFTGIYLDEHGSYANYKKGICIDTVSNMS